MPMVSGASEWFTCSAAQGRRSGVCGVGDMGDKEAPGHGGQMHFMIIPHLRADRR
jgi:hypothetical protein